MLFHWPWTPDAAQMSDPAILKTLILQKGYKSEGGLLGTSASEAAVSRWRAHGLLEALGWRYVLLVRRRQGVTLWPAT